MDLNQGPLDMQSNALPLSHTPHPLILSFSLAPFHPWCCFLPAYSSLLFPRVPGGGRSSPLSSALPSAPLQPASSSGRGNSTSLYTWSFESLLLLLLQPAHGYQDKSRWFRVFSEPQTQRRESLLHTPRPQGRCSLLHSFIHSLNKHSWNMFGARPYHPC